MFGYGVLMMDEMIPQEYPVDPQAQAIGQYPYPIERPTEKPPVDAVAQVNAQLSMTNIANELSDSRLDTIGQRVIDDYETDLDSRADWQREQDAIADIVKMTTEVKHFAGKVVSNVKFPMILNAAIHYAARAYPEIVKGKDVCKCAVIGRDPDGKKAAQADRVGQHMSYQLLEKMDWESELDQLLMTYSITGSEFKKTYYCPIKERNVSEMVFARDLVVDYWAKSIDDTARVTHVIEMGQNGIVERINAGVFRDGLSIDDFGQPDSDETGANTADDKDIPHVFLEQHRWLDLDDDGYQEPYVVLVHKKTAKVARIAARYDVSGVHLTDDGKLKRIEPVNYFTHFKFMPSPDGGFYGVGFGKLLFGLNNSVNTNLNQLIDAGTAANRKSGFIARGLQIGPTSQRNDGFSLGYGEWKSIPSTGDDIRKNMVEIPSKEPSSVLFQLMQFLIETGNALASVSDILSGESPGPNVPAASTLALIEQGMKVFNGIFKRLYRSLKEEFIKLARLNRLYLPEESYYAVLDDERAIKQSDYSDTSFDIVPVADPNNLSDLGRAMKMKALMELVGQGFKDDVIRRRYLESLNIEDVDELIPEAATGPPPIPPEVQAQIDKLNAETKKTDSEAVESSVRAQFAGMQAANIIASTPTVTPIADALLLSAGFVDKDASPIVPQGVQPQQGLPQLPQNTSPGFPALPGTGEVGMNRGIETQRNEEGVQQ